jgi:hypothetical protein
MGDCVVVNGSDGGTDSLALATCDAIGARHVQLVASIGGGPGIVWPGAEAAAARAKDACASAAGSAAFWPGPTSWSMGWRDAVCAASQ